LCADRLNDSVYIESNQAGLHHKPPHRDTEFRELSEAPALKTAKRGALIWFFRSAEPPNQYRDGRDRA